MTLVEYFGKDVEHHEEFKEALPFGIQFSDSFKKLQKSPENTKANPGLLQTAAPKLSMTGHQMEFASECCKTKPKKKKPYRA